MRSSNWISMAAAFLVVQSLTAQSSRNSNTGSNSLSSSFSLGNSAGGSSGSGSSRSSGFGSSGSGGFGSSSSGSSGASSMLGQANSLSAFGTNGTNAALGLNQSGQSGFTASGANSGGMNSQRGGNSRMGGGGGGGGNNRNSNSSNQSQFRGVGVQRYTRPVIRPGFTAAPFDAAATSSALTTFFSNAKDLPGLKQLQVTVAADGIAKMTGSAGTPYQQKIAAIMIQMEPGVRRVDVPAGPKNNARVGF